MKHNDISTFTNTNSFPNSCMCSLNVNYTLRIQILCNLSFRLVEVLKSVTLLLHFEFLRMLSLKQRGYGLVALPSQKVTIGEAALGLSGLRLGKRCNFSLLFCNP